MTERRIAHRHVPVYRVVRVRWDDPLDAAFSRSAPDRRWNTAEFPALYCCCSVGVARAVALHLFRKSGLEIEDLQPDVRPQLVEIQWSGSVVDVASAEGVEAAGFAAEYPVASDKKATRAAAERWHANGAQGVCARSASLHRLGVTDWSGDHRRYSELALFVENGAPPRLLRRRDDTDWLRARRPER